MSQKLTRQQHDELINTYEEATSRDHYSVGAWHMMLVACVRLLGFDVRNFHEAKNITEDILNEQDN